MRNTSVKLVSLFALPCSGLRKCKYPAEKRNKTNSWEIDVTSLTIKEQLKLVERNFKQKERISEWCKILNNMQ